MEVGTIIETKSIFKKVARKTKLKAIIVEACIAIPVIMATLIFKQYEVDFRIFVCVMWGLFTLALYVNVLKMPKSVELTENKIISTIVSDAVTTVYYKDIIKITFESLKTAKGGHIPNYYLVLHGVKKAKDRKLDNLLDQGNVRQDIVEAAQKRSAIKIPLGSLLTTKEKEQLVNIILEKNPNIIYIGKN